MVRGPLDPAGPVPAVCCRDLWCRCDQCTGRDRGVAVDPGQVADAITDRAVDLRAGWWPTLGPCGLVPPEPEEHSVIASTGEGSERVECVSERTDRGEVEAGQREPGLRDVHVRV